MVVMELWSRTRWRRVNFTCTFDLAKSTTSRHRRCCTSVRYAYVYTVLLWRVFVVALLPLPFFTLIEQEFLTRLEKLARRLPRPVPRPEW